LFYVAGPKLITGFVKTPNPFEVGDILFLGLKFPSVLF
jgi:hypothetical protein